MDPSRETQLVETNDDHQMTPKPKAEGGPTSKASCISIATISSGFEKGDFLVREEKGQRVYFDFFEEAFNYIAYKGYIRMPKDEENEWMQTMNDVHASVKGGMKYNTGRLLMVLFRPIEERES